MLRNTHFAAYIQSSISSGISPSPFDSKFLRIARYSSRGNVSFGPLSPCVFRGWVLCDCPVRGRWMTSSSSILPMASCWRFVSSPNRPCGSLWRCPDTSAPSRPLLPAKGGGGGQSSLLPWYPLPLLPDPRPPP